MSAFLAEQLNHWAWWVLGAGFFVLEILVSGAFLMWFGVAAIAIGFVVLTVPDLSWEYQILLFAVFSVISLGGGRAYIKRRPIATDQPTLNRRGEQYVDRLLTLDEDIVNGVGKVRVDDSTWKVEGDDMPEKYIERCICP